MLLKNTSILVIDDDTDVLIAIKMLLKSQVKEVVVEKNPNNLSSLIEKKRFDIVILDMNYDSVVNTGNEGIYWLNKIKKIAPTDANILILGENGTGKDLIAKAIHTNLTKKRWTICKSGWKASLDESWGSNN